MADVDKLLRGFLEDDEKRRREGKTIEKLHEKQDAMMTAVRRVVKDRLEDRQKIAIHGRAIKTMQHQIELLTQRNKDVPDWRPAPDEITGAHALKDIARAQRELEEEWEEEQKRKHDEATWWRRQGWIWAMAVVTLIVGSSLGGCVQYVIHRIEKAEAAAHAPSK